MQGAPVKRNSLLSMLRGSGGSGLSGFADLADESRLGELPTDEDLRLLLFDPLGASPAALAGASGGLQAGTAVEGAAGAAAAAWQASGQPEVPAGAHLHPALFFRQAAWGSGAPTSSSGQATHRLASPAQQLALAAAAPGMYEAAAAVYDSCGRQPVLASLKRRVDRLDLEGAQQDSSPRSSKRHSSGAAWSSGGGADSGSESLLDDGATPRSATPRGGSRAGG